MTKIFASTIAAGLMSIAAMAQPTVTAHIPFAFYVGNTKLPAGSYEIETGMSKILRIKDVSTRNLAVAFNPVLITRPTALVQPGKLVFYRYGNNVFLSEMWPPGDLTGRLVPRTGLELELARQIQPVRIESLTRK
jgi:hypothetical protein